MKIFLGIYLLFYVIIGIVAWYYAFKYRKLMLKSGLYYILIYHLLNIIIVVIIGSQLVLELLGFKISEHQLLYYVLKFIDELISENYYYVALLICVQYMGIITQKNRFFLTFFFLITFIIEAYLTNFITINEEFVNLTFTPLAVKSFVIVCSLLFLKRQISSNAILYLKDNPYLWLALGLLISMTLNLVLLVSKFNNYATEENQAAMMIIGIGEVIALIFYIVAARKSLNWNKLEILLS